MPHIEAIRALEILDSRGQPTVLAEVRLDNGLSTQAMVPSGRLQRARGLGVARTAALATWAKGCCRRSRTSRRSSSRP